MVKKKHIKNEQINNNSYMLYKILRNDIPEGISLQEVLLALEYILADTCLLANLNSEEFDKTFDAIKKDVVVFMMRSKEYNKKLN